MNSDNLIPQAHVLSVEEASRGGKASGEARRERRKLRELLEIALSQAHYQLDGTETTKGEAIVASMVNRAIDGDVSAARWVRDTCEGQPRQSVSLEVPQIPQATYDKVARILEGADD